MVNLAAGPGPGQEYDRLFDPANPPPPVFDLPPPPPPDPAELGLSGGGGGFCRDLGDVLQCDRISVRNARRPSHIQTYESCKWITREHFINLTAGD